MLDAAERDAMLAILDEELDRLSDHYRLPVVLCDLQGRSRKASRSRIEDSEGTLSSRLATAKRKLADRLKRQCHPHGDLALGSDLGKCLGPECLMLSFALRFLPRRNPSSLSKQPIRS